MRGFLYIELVDDFRITYEPRNTYNAWACGTG